jgi:hypothetical protein
MKNLDEIKMLAATLPIHEVIMAMPDEEPPPDSSTGSEENDVDP